MQLQKTRDSQNNTEQEKKNQAIGITISDF